MLGGLHLASGGIFSVSPRYWEGYLLASTQILPLRWSLDLFGMGDLVSKDERGSTALSSYIYVFGFF